MKRIPLFLLTLAVFPSSLIHAATIAINSTNFSVTNTNDPPSVANTYTARSLNGGHVGLQYSGGTDFLNSDQRFTLTFDYTGGATPAGGAGLWFGTSSSANWVFVNEQVSSDDLIRNFGSRNLTSHSGGGTVTSSTITNSNLVSGATYTLTLDRVFSGGSYFLENIEVRNSLSSVIGTLADVNVGTDAAWGVTILATSAINGATATTTTISSLNVGTIPEPSSYAFFVSGMALMTSLCRRNFRRTRVDGATRPTDGGRK